MRRNLTIMALIGASVFAPALLAGGGRKKQAPPELSHRARHTSAWLKKEVGHRLRMLPYYSVFDNLEYRVKGYRVELLGQVVRPTLKSDAAAAVRSIEGVEGVTNHIEVLPLSPNDNRIRLACYRAIFYQPVLEKYAIEPVPSIHIIVKDGNIVLVGVVDSRMDQQVADIQARGVPGAFSVTDRLRVEKD
jgi:osmotically-inducible protein OsmY